MLPVVPYHNITPAILTLCPHQLHIIIPFTPIQERNTNNNNERYIPPRSKSRFPCISHRLLPFRPSVAQSQANGRLPKSNVKGRAWQHAVFRIPSSFLRCTIPH